MVKTKKPYPALVAFAIAAASLAGCSGDIGVSMPLKETLLGKPVPEPNLPDRPPLVIPPQNAALPVPGQPQQTAGVANSQWPADAQNVKRQ